MRWGWSLRAPDATALRRGSHAQASRCRARGSTSSSSWSARWTASCKPRPKADAGYFAAICGRAVDAAEARAIEAAFLKAYRWQYIHSGAQHPQFGKVLSSLITEDQGRRIQAALATLQ